MTPAEIMAIAIGCVMSVIAWFIKRDVARFEHAVARQSTLLEKHAEMLAAMQVQMVQVLEVGKWNPMLSRFFGEGGGQARLWRNIEALEASVEQCRERDHWVANKLTILKHRTDKKAAPGEDWKMPEWKAPNKREATT